MIIYYISNAYVTLGQGYIRFVLKAHSELSRCVPEEVFDRYNIVSDADLRLATQRQEAYLESIAGTITGTIAKFEQKNRPAD